MHFSVYSAAVFYGNHCQSVTQILTSPCEEEKNLQLSSHLFFKAHSYMYCLSLSTGSMNFLEVVVDSTNPAETSVECMFEPGYTCTIDYGTDSSYTNLVYSDNSTTRDWVTIITLSQEIQRNTTYYFIVSAQSSSQCERVRGTFRTGECINSGVQLTCRWCKRKGKGIHKTIEFKRTSILSLHPFI